MILIIDANIVIFFFHDAILISILKASRIAKMYEWGEIQRMIWIIYRMQKECKNADFVQRFLLCHIFQNHSSWLLIVCTSTFQLFFMSVAWCFGQRFFLENKTKKLCRSLTTKYVVRGQKRYQNAFRHRHKYCFSALLVDTG